MAAIKSSYGGLKIASDSYVVCICGMTLSELTGSRMPDIVQFLDKHAHAARDVIVVSYDRLHVVEDVSLSRLLCTESYWWPVSTEVLHIPTIERCRGTQP